MIEKQISEGWSPTPEIAIEYVRQIKPDVFAMYGPKPDMGFMQFPEYSHLSHSRGKGGGPYVGRVKERLQQSIIDNPGLSTEQQQEIARQMKDDIYDEFGLPPV